MHETETENLGQAQQEHRISFLDTSSIRGRRTSNESFIGVYDRRVQLSKFCRDSLGLSEGDPAGIAYDESGEVYLVVFDGDHEMSAPITRSGRSVSISRTKVVKELREFFGHDVSRIDVDTTPIRQNGHRLYRLKNPR